MKTGLTVALPKGRLLEPAVEHPRDDLHVAVRMQPETGAGCDDVVVVHEEEPVVRVRRVVVIREAEAVPRIEPVEFAVEAFVRAPDIDRLHARHQSRVPGAPLNGPATRDVIQPPDWAMYPYDALKLIENALSSSRATGAPLLNQLNGGAQIIGANGDSRAYNAGYHEGVSPADMYFARFEGFVFVPVGDDPLSGTLPRVDQLAG